MTQQPDPHGIDGPAEDADGADREIADLLGELGKQLGIDTADGWGGINDAGKGLLKQRRQQLQAMKAEADVFRDTFATPAGVKCLRLMREMTVDAEPYPTEAQLPVDVITPLVIAHTAICKFYRSIENAIAVAENSEAKGVSP